MNLLRNFYARPQVAVFVLLPGLWLGACGSISDSITGNGKTKSVVRQLPAFDKISVKDGIAVSIQQGSEQSVEFTARRDSVDHIKATVDDGHLSLSVSGFETIGGTKKVTITIPALSEVHLADQTSAELRDLAATSLSLSADDNASFSGSGHSDHLDVSLSGNASAHLSGFVGGTESVNLHDNTTLELAAGQSASGHLFDNSSAAIHPQDASTNVDIGHDGNASLQVN